MPEITVEQNTAFTIDTVETSEFLSAGSEYSFKVSPTEGNKIEKVLVNGNAVEAKDGVYTVTLAAENTFTVESSSTAEPTPTPTESPETTPTPTPTEDEESDSNIIIYIIIGAAVVVAGVVVFVIVKKKKH